VDDNPERLDEEGKPERIYWIKFSTEF